MSLRAGISRPGSVVRKHAASSWPLSPGNGHAHGVTDRLASAAWEPSAEQLAFARRDKRPGTKTVP